jgi:hypothetical protein
MHLPRYAAAALALTALMALAGCNYTTYVLPPPNPGSGSQTFPTIQTTGWAPTGVALQPYTGPSDITTNGTTIDGADIPFALTIEADNVTITRSRILGSTSDTYVVEQMAGASGLMLRDDEIGPKTASNHPDRAVASFGTHMTLDHVYVHGTQRGIQTGDYTTVEDSYSDNFYNKSGNHATAVMSLGGTAHVTLQHNTFGCDTGECSSAMSVYPQTDFGGPNNDWTITQNLFNGGSYCVYLGYSPQDGESPNTNMRVTDNFFGVEYYSTCGIYGPVGSWYAGTGDVWTNNIWYAPGLSADGTPVSPN